MKPSKYFYTKINYSAIIFLLFFIINPFYSNAQTKISPYLFGENAWAPNEIFKVQDQIKKVKYQVIRIGGNGYENSGFVYQEAIKLINFARSVGAEPIFQIPRQLKDNDKAFKAIEYINGKMKENIKLWCIGNEPDHHNQLASPEEVSNYFKKISEQIKRYDPKAKVMGFDLASYKPLYLSRLLGGDLDVTGKIPGKDYYYLDVVTFHGYNFPDISKFEKEVNQLQSTLKGLNKSRPDSQKLKWAITEFNSHWIVDPKLGEDYMPFNFHNGQLYAQVYDLGMRAGAFTICPWSMLEGGAHRSGTDLSLFDEEDGKYLPRSNYYHTMLLAQNFRNNYLKHSANTSDLKIIPMGDDKGLSIMILNISKTQSHVYTLAFDDTLKIKSAFSINANINQTYIDSIGAETTQMLLFNTKGELIKKWSYNKIQAEAMESPVEEK
ncbi:hypothetical protein I5M32_13195 [Pedobacter sp. SD-b]|uniref:Glycosyl hydrolase catalytic core n=1 Tax=Pedobacter segetis TaxID=2793069 RepID=A0ABS1BM80_9SPHI|nr:hypothetical protein [Pedobacter segetis]MBK0383918.1 hypothetical protein [Pedobacter segetis]